MDMGMVWMPSIDMEGGAVGTATWIAPTWTAAQSYLRPKQSEKLRRDQREGWRQVGPAARSSHNRSTNTYAPAAQGAQKSRTRANIYTNEFPY